MIEATELPFSMKDLGDRNKKYDVTVDGKVHKRMTMTLETIPGNIDVIKFENEVKQ